ncbi:VOC family protein, partial [Candidatus Pelagibacter sp.]|nr:VOC family protein [Candidatus Pelagibacter sp.]
IIFYYRVQVIMKYLHTMIRISDIEKSLDFYCNGLGLIETRRIENEQGRFTLIFLAAPGDEKAELELTYNWDGDKLGDGSRNFGHLAYRIENIYEICERLKDMGYTINRPPRDGHMAFVRSPDNISIEILQDGNLEIKEPWASMKNKGVW